MKKAKILIILLISTLAAYSQQNAQYSQNMFNQMADNPGYAGSNGQVCATVISRQQWIGFEGAPNTTLLTIDAAVNLFGIKNGFALEIENDEIGFENNFNILGTYAYRTSLWRGELGVGLSGGLINKAIDGNFNPITAEDPVIPENDGDMGFDLGLGVFYHDRKFYTGLSVSHLNQPGFEISGTEISYQRRHYFFAAGYNFRTPIPLLELKPSVFVKSDGGSAQISVNANARYNKKFWGGISYRHNDAIIAMLGLELFNGIKIGYAYDLNISKLSKYNQGTHEIMVGYCFDLGLDKQPNSYRNVRFL